MNNLYRLSYENGQFMEEAIQCDAVSLAETSALIPSGAYTTFRTYHHNCVLNLTRHLDRLENTCKLAGTSLVLDRKALRDVMRRIISAYSSDEIRMRITIDLSKEIGTIYIAVEPLSTPTAEQYKNGVDVGTAVMQRSNPKAKLSSFLAKAADAKAAHEKEYYEIIMLTPEELFLEGLSSNFYAVIDNVLYTAEDGVLSGTTRDYVLELLRKNNIPYKLQSVSFKQLDQIDEAFITSTSRSILPIRTINDKVLGKIVPGPLTKRLMTCFDSDLAQYLEEV